MQNQLEFNNDQIQTESHHENEEHFDNQGEENYEEEHQENIEEMEEMNLEEENNDEDNNEFGEEQAEERDTFQKTLTQNIGEDVMQIPEPPIHTYYDAENFCDYTP